VRDGRHHRRERWASFDAAEIASRLAGNPVFERVSVEKSFPDRVSVTLVERVPVAISFAEIGGKTVPIEIDRSGVAFRVGASVREAALPLLTGLTFENFVPGTRLNPALKGLLEQIHARRGTQSRPSRLGLRDQGRPKTLRGIRPRRLSRPRPVRVRTDKTLNEDALQYMMLVLDVVKDMRVDVDEIDIRAGTVSYRAKGEAL
jgi:cell division protein FtsQ